MPIVKTRKEAAEVLGVDERSIGNWKLEDGFPSRDDGQYDTDKIVAWRAATKQQRSKVTEFSEQVSLKTKATRLQILELKRQTDEMELELRRGNLMPRELVRELLSILTGRIRDASASLTRQGNIQAAKVIADQLSVAEKQINDRLDRAIRESSK